MQPSLIVVPQVTEGDCLRLKYLNKAITGSLEGTLEKIKRFVSSKVYCRSCILYACAKLSQGSRVLVLIFVNKFFVIGKPLTKITKIFLLENFQLYGSLCNTVVSPVASCTLSYNGQYINQYF